MPGLPDLHGLAELSARVARLREGALALEREHAHAVPSGHLGAGSSLPMAAASARNLLHYLALRREDLRDLHTPLAELGLSSLGRSESHVLANLDAVLAALAALAGARPVSPPSREEPGPITLSAARELLERRTHALLGPARERGPRIMVTLPGEAAVDPALVARLLDAGMTCARINSAHDDADAWARMARHVRDAVTRQHGPAARVCPVLIDLAGPKLRTGPIEPGPEVLRVKPVRDALGRVLSPGVFTLRGDDRPPGVGIEAPIASAFLAGLRVGDTLDLTDTRGRERALRVVEAGPGRALLTCDFTVYLASGMLLRLRDAAGRPAVQRLGRLAPVPQAITVRPGDTLHLALTERIGRPAGSIAHHAANGTAHPAPPAVLTSTLPEAFAAARVGDHVWIDDGRVGAVIAERDAASLLLRVVHAAPEGSRIREDKGINLPDTPMPGHGLTARDLDVLPVAIEHADIVGLSFVNDPEDVLALRQRLAERGGTHLGTVLKIETRRAFENLPGLLLAALQGPSAGIMIARGDLAVEVGYDRLAEVQEEILWLCEAAHMPVIWATQVLETMAKTGQPSRAEVTDAAMGERAECVMLNKGRHIVEAVRFLDDLLRRMQRHQSKKRPMLRSLSVARQFGRPPAG